LAKGDIGRLIMTSSYSGVHNMQLVDIFYICQVAARVAKLVLGAFWVQFRGKEVVEGQRWHYLKERRWCPHRFCQPLRYFFA